VVQLGRSSVEPLDGRRHDCGRAARRRRAFWRGSSRGAHRWYLDWQGAFQHAGAAKTGLALPLNVELFREEYAASQDHIGRFIEECLVVDANLTVPKTDVYAVFKRWRGTGEVSNRNKLYARIKRLRGVTVHRDREFHGVGLRLPSITELMVYADDAR
jgi:hypothetical protein